MVQTNADVADYIFTGILDAYAWFNVSGAEVSYQKNDGEKIDALVQCRIENTISSIIDLLKNELDLLKKR